MSIRSLITSAGTGRRFAYPAMCSVRRPAYFARARFNKFATRNTPRTKNAPNKNPSQNWLESNSPAYRPRSASVHHSARTLGHHGVKPKHKLSGCGLALAYLIEADGIADVR